MFERKLPCPQIYCHFFLRIFDIPFLSIIMTYFHYVKYKSILFGCNFLILINLRHMCKTTFSSYKKALALLSLFAIFSFPAINAQTTIDVLTPVGGFEIDADVQANTNTPQGGDWVQNGSPGGFVLDIVGNDPQAVVPFTTSVSEDLYNSNADNRFGGGDKFDDDPNTWGWTTNSVLAKNDMNHAFMHLAQDPIGDQWIFLATDRRGVSGSSYIDFELFQNTLTANSGGTFTSLGPDGGRTVGDVLLSVEYSNGGDNVNILFYRWESVGGPNFGYVNQNIPTFPVIETGLTNVSSFAIPYEAFGGFSYNPYQFVEAAINITAIFNTVVGDICEGIIVKSLLIKSKSSDSPSANLSDFIGPVTVNLGIGTATIAYDDVCEDESIIPVQLIGVDGGTFSATPSGLTIDGSTGEIDVTTSTPGTYIVTYQYGPMICDKTAVTEVTIFNNPVAPIS